jgi:hypothetical protein
MKYGYTRVSTDGQSIDAQVRQFKAAGARQVRLVKRRPPSGGLAALIELRDDNFQQGPHQQRPPRQYLIKPGPQP